MLNLARGSRTLRRDDRPGHTPYYDRGWHEQPEELPSGILRAAFGVPSHLPFQTLRADTLLLLSILDGNGFLSLLISLVVPLCFAYPYA